MSITMENMLQNGEQDKVQASAPIIAKLEQMMEQYSRIKEATDSWEEPLPVVAGSDQGDGLGDESAGEIYDE